MPNKPCKKCKGGWRKQNPSLFEVMQMLMWVSKLGSTDNPYDKTCTTCKGTGRVKNIKPAFRAIGG